MSKRKGQTNGNEARVAERVGSAGNAVPDGLDTAGAHDAGVQAAGTAPSADGTVTNAPPIVVETDGVDSAADGKGVSDGGRQELPGLEAGEGATPGADAKTADTSRENISGDIGVGSGSGSIENDGDASADGAADGGKDGSVSGEADDQPGSVGGGSTAAPGGGDGSGPSSGNDNNLEHVGDGNKDENVSGDDAGGSAVSSDLKAALELAGCETLEDLVDMARIGSNLMGAIDDVRRCEGPFKEWAPADDPVEIVHDLYAALEHAWEKAGALKQSVPEDDKPWWLEMPNLAEGVDPLEISRFVARDVFVGVHGSVEVLGALIRNGHPLETPAIPFEALSGLVDLVRQIGTRATPDVMAQHLIITKHRQSADLTKAEELSLKAFASILIDLDDFAAAEKKRLEELVAEKPEPRPVPIEDTTMETVNDTLETW
ncbi:hypothetical protein [Agrobacterium sp. ICMP 6402]|uniref:hypothetical protein n=1 Tax=Agrobacterium sp. ICMP 6402 TaxID=2292443 RepID=UPI00129657C0|nr:hypothetical protein [Agrobacterium sp. ICMP 6402]